MAEKSDVFCPIPRGPKTFVWAASITVDPPLTLEQTTHPSVRIQSKYSGLLSGPRRGRDRFRRTGTIRFGGRPRCNGTLRRNGTRLLTTITSVLSWRDSARPGTPQWHPRPSFFLFKGRRGSGRPDPAAELLFAVLPEAAVLLAAQHGLPVRTIHPGSHGLLRHRIEDPFGPNVRLANCVGLLHDLDSLSLHQAVDAHFAAGAGSDLPIGGELKGVVGRDIRRPAGCCFEIDQPPFHVQHVHPSPDCHTGDLTLHIEFDGGGFHLWSHLVHVLGDQPFT